MKTTSLDEGFLAHDSPQLIEDPIELINYRRDSSVYPAGHPQAAVRVKNAEEVARVLKTASQRNLPVYVRAAGSTYAGGANPSRGGIVLDISPMNRVLEIDESRGLVVVEPGVTYGALLAALQRHGLTIGIVPLTGPAGTVGGAVASHGLGTGSPKFQGTGDEVAGLEVVLPDGKLLRTGSAVLADAGFFQRYAVGPDLTGLFLGANGSLGVISKIALWVHPLPAHQETMAVSFPGYAAGAGFIAQGQVRELFRNVWYGAGYDESAIAGRINAARPDLSASPKPQFCFGLDLRGEAAEVRVDRMRIVKAAQAHGGDEFTIFDEVFFSKLRRDFSFWYSYAGYFTRSMCALLMTSMASSTMPRFFDLVAIYREAHPEFVWGGGTVLCRRGLHGAVIIFYDEQTQWDAAQRVSAECCERLLKIGCVPYKTGKVWAAQMEKFPAYYQTLSALKKTLDPKSLLSPGNLAL